MDSLGFGPHPVSSIPRRTWLWHLIRDKETGAALECFLISDIATRATESHALCQSTA